MPNFVAQLAHARQRARLENTNNRKAGGDFEERVSKGWSSKIVTWLLLSVLPTFGLTLVPLTLYALAIDFFGTKKLTHPADVLAVLMPDVFLSKIIFYTAGLLSTLVFFSLLLLIVVAVYFILNPTEGIMAFTKAALGFISK